MRDVSYLLAIVLGNMFYFIVFLAMSHIMS